jgi:predicted alpha/beta hydrolase family esterase
MSESFLILHGIENHRPPQHWQYWLTERLREAGHVVTYPGLPEPDAPSYRDWEKVLHTLLPTAVGERRTVVCHSLACLLWFRAAGDLSHPVDRLLLVAPPASECVPESGASFRLEQFDPKPVRASVAGELTIACSDDDPYNPQGAEGLYGDPLDVKAQVLARAGHITPADGFGPWPWALEWCLNQ